MLNSLILGSENMQLKNEPTELKDKNGKPKMRKVIDVKDHFKSLFQIGHSKFKSETFIPSFLTDP